jgi:phosphoribosylformimino-5-aminoimidazole carboxamide ribotide isomerase
MSALLYPSIDLLGGDVVRLQQGDYDRVTNYAASPTELVTAYAEAGCRWLHVVDLDAARSGDTPNLALIADLVAMLVAICGCRSAAVCAALTVRENSTDLVSTGS